jgi:hypothetical protein
VQVRTYCFPGCFTRPPGHLDSQPPPRANHVEAKSPPWGKCTEERTRSRSAARRCKRPAFGGNVASGYRIAWRPSVCEQGNRPVSPRRPQFLAGGSGSQLEEVPVPDLVATASNRPSTRLHQRHTCSPPKASVDRIKQEPHNSLKPGPRVQPLSTQAHHCTNKLSISEAALATASGNHLWVCVRVLSALLRPPAP